MVGEQAQSRLFTLRNRLGMHARPAALFVTTASRFRSEIHVEKDNQVANGKSILGLLTLAAAEGSSLTVRATGEDAVEALDAIEKLVARKFDED